MLSMTKYDRHGYKPRSRILVVTKETLYLLDGQTLKIKQQTPLSNLKGKLHYFGSPFTLQWH